MNEHFIKEIEIKNFKCFENFKAEGFGRINLIGGKNNVGKTAFMEACLLNTFCENKVNIHCTLAGLTLIEVLRDFTKTTYKTSEIIELFEKFNNLSISSNLNTHKFKIQKENFNIYFLLNNKKENLEFNINGTFLSPDINYFLPSYMVGDDLIISIFDKIKEQRKRENLNQILNQFDKNILEFDVINNKPQVFLESSQNFQNVVELGHGLKRYIAIISSILINKDGFLFLDEIENGIHYTNLDKLWKIILTISKEQNVQVFATTHSKECIEAYYRTVKELEDKDITFIELGKNREDEIKAMVYPYEWFVDSIEDKEEVRGW